MKSSLILGAISILAAATITAKRFVTSVGAVPAAGVWCPGVAADNFDAGEQAAVVTHGVMLVEAGAAVAADAAVQCDALGRAITLAAGISLGRSLDAAAAAGDLIRIKLA